MHVNQNTPSPIDTVSQKYEKYDFTLYSQKLVRLVCYIILMNTVWQILKFHIELYFMT